MASYQTRLAPVLDTTGVVPYHVVPRKSPRDKSVKYYAQKDSQTAIAFLQLCSEVAHATTHTPSDVMGVLAEVGTRALEYVKNGKAVDLGPLGMFRSTLSSGGADKAESFEASLIKALNPRWYRPQSWYKQLRQNVSFTRTDGKKKAAEAPQG